MALSLPFIALLQLACAAGPQVAQDEGLQLERLPSQLEGQQPSSTAKLPPDVTSETLHRGLEQPTALRFAPDGRVFVSEQRGTVRVYPRPGDESGSTLIDIRSEVFNAGQLGLLGLALDPDFEHEPYLYLAYTHDAPISGSAPTYGQAGADRDACPADQTCLVSARISRFRLGADGNAGPEQVLIEDWCNSSLVHTIGAIVFDETGALLAGGGDGAHGSQLDHGQLAEPPNACPADGPDGVVWQPPDAVGGSLRSQGMRVPAGPLGLNGTLIRIDRATGRPLADNPGYSEANPLASAVIAHGLRNPFRFAIRPGTRELWIADPGWDQYEEINHIADPLTGPVPNFGWPCFEGRHPQPAHQAAGHALCTELHSSPPAELRMPALSVGRLGDEAEPCYSERSAFSALAFHEGAALPAKYSGALFFADIARRCIWYAPASPDGTPDFERLALFALDHAVVDLRSGPDGRLYYVDYLRGAIGAFGSLTD